MTLILVISVAAVLLAGPGGPSGRLLRDRLLRGVRSAEERPEPRLVMVLLLVELRSGMSVLAALQAVAARLPSYGALGRVSRVATVSGLIAALSEADDDLRPVVAQLGRAQRSGASLASAVRRMIYQDLAQMRSERLAEARSLGVRLMIPVTLLMLPGLILILYAPSLIRTFGRLTGSWP